ncbi:hypothetical protein BDR03DRAFT_1013523 [Suillus americanus]|nr:hypothetical protein BDR03DRAFT_1013523 [Suillus americanus]
MDAEEDQLTIDRQRLSPHSFPILNQRFGSVLLNSMYPKDPQPYHTSALSGQDWVIELLTGHPEYIHCELGMHAGAFVELISQLRAMGHSDSKFISLEEQLTIFLYTSVTGLSILLLPPAYAMELQAWIPAALCAIHNFIHVHDSTNIPTNDNDNDNEDWQGGYFGRNAVEEDNELKFHQGSAMWEDYQRISLEWAFEGIDLDDLDKGDEDEDIEDTADEDEDEDDFAFE